MPISAVATAIWQLALVCSHAENNRNWYHPPSGRLRLELHIHLSYQNVTVY